MDVVSGYYQVLKGGVQKSEWVNLPKPRPALPGSGASFPLPGEFAWNPPRGISREVSPGRLPGKPPAEILWNLGGRRVPRGGFPRPLLKRRIPTRRVSPAAIKRGIPPRGDFPRPLGNGESARRIAPILAPLPVAGGRIRRRRRGKRASSPTLYPPTVMSIVARRVVLAKSGVEYPRA